MKIDEKTKKKIKIIVISIIIVIILWFLVVSPILKFKKNEKVVKEAAQRYYEINSGQLPTGEKVKTVALQTLYDKDFINEDLRSSYMNKVCDSKVSWVKVKKENGEYKYYVYLKCGIFSSKVDHKGPEIKLKGEDEITINKGEKYKESGIDSVVDDTDGKMNIKDVKIDNTKVNTNKIGTYEVTYKIKDSFNNETVKVRTVKVIETLNHIVEKDTGKKKVYQGSQYNNYVKLDGILFKIVGENEDGTVKIVSDENLAAVNYEGIDSWLNDYFYGKLSDSAKKLIVKSKWCNETVNNPENYTKCNSYGKKSYVGLLSVADINNSKGDDGSYNIGPEYNFWLANKKNNNKSWSTFTGEYKEESISTNLTIKPTMNIAKDITVISGTGSMANPYVLKGNKNTLKVGSKISEAKAGEYINYSGYLWRTIGKETDGTTSIIMNDVVNIDNSTYYTSFTDGSTISYNPEKSGNIGYVVTNDIVEYISTKMFANRKVIINNYNGNIEYNGKYTQKSYQSKITIPSMYDLFSTSVENGYWFRDYSSKTSQYCYTSYMGTSICTKYNDDDNTINGVRVLGYLKSNTKVKKGNGTESNPYELAD